MQRQCCYDFVGFCLDTENMDIFFYILILNAFFIFLVIRDMRVLATQLSIVSQTDGLKCFSLRPELQVHSVDLCGPGAGTDTKAILS